MERDILANWPGGYVLINERDYFYVPGGTDIMSSHYLIRPANSEPVVANFCPSGGVAMDVGANFGEWSLQMARAVGQTGQVFAFEPSADIAEALRKTLRVNGQSQTTVIEAAVSSRAGDAEFTVNEAHSGKSGINIGNTDGASNKVTVKTISLDDFARRQTLRRLDLIKIDVEGHEADVLEGAESVLKTFAPAIVLEAGVDPDHDRGKVKDILERHRYTMAGAISPHGIIETTWNDYLCLSGLFANGFVNILLISAQDDRKAEDS